jgi:hypothetical protein
MHQESLKKSFNDKMQEFLMVHFQNVQRIQAVIQTEGGEQMICEIRSDQKTKNEINFKYKILAVKDPEKQIMYQTLQPFSQITEDYLNVFLCKVSPNNENILITEMTLNDQINLKGLVSPKFHFGKEALTNPGLNAPLVLSKQSSSNQSFLAMLASTKSKNVFIDTFPRFDRIYTNYDGMFQGCRIFFPQNWPKKIENSKVLENFNKMKDFHKNGYVLQLKPNGSLVCSKFSLNLPGNPEELSKISILPPEKSVILNNKNEITIFEGLLEKPLPDPSGNGRLNYKKFKRFTETHDIIIFNSDRPVSFNQLNQNRAVQNVKIPDANIYFNTGESFSGRMTNSGRNGAGIQTIWKSTAELADLNKINQVVTIIEEMSGQFIDSGANNFISAKVGEETNPNWWSLKFFNFSNLVEMNRKISEPSFLEFFQMLEFWNLGIEEIKTRYEYCESENKMDQSANIDCFELIKKEMDGVLIFEKHDFYILKVQLALEELFREYRLGKINDIPRTNFEIVNLIQEKMDPSLPPTLLSSFFKIYLMFLKPYDCFENFKCNIQYWYDKLDQQFNEDGTPKKASEDDSNSENEPLCFSQPELSNNFLVALKKQRDQFSNFVKEMDKSNSEPIAKLKTILDSFPIFAIRFKVNNSQSDKSDESSQQESESLLIKSVFWYNRVELADYLLSFRGQYSDVSKKISEVKNKRKIWDSLELSKQFKTIKEKLEANFVLSFEELQHLFLLTAGQIDDLNSNYIDQQNEKSIFCKNLENCFTLEESPINILSDESIVENAKDKAVLIHKTLMKRHILTNLDQASEKLKPKLDKLIEGWLQEKNQNLNDNQDNQKIAEKWADEFVAEKSQNLQTKLISNFSKRGAEPVENRNRQESDFFEQILKEIGWKSKDSENLNTNLKQKLNNDLKTFFEKKFANYKKNGSENVQEESENVQEKESRDTVKEWLTDRAQIYIYNKVENEITSLIKMIKFIHKTFHFSSIQREEYKKEIQGKDVDKNIIAETLDVPRFSAKREIAEFVLSADNLGNNFAEWLESSKLSENETPIQEHLKNIIDFNQELDCRALIWIFYRKHETAANMIIKFWKKIVQLGLDFLKILNEQETKLMKILLEIKKIEHENRENFTETLTIIIHQKINSELFDDLLQKPRKPTFLKMLEENYEILQSLKDEQLKELSIELFDENEEGSKGDFVKLNISEIKSDHFSWAKMTPDDIINSILGVVIFKIVNNFLDRPNNKIIPKETDFQNNTDSNFQKKKQSSKSSVPRKSKPDSPLTDKEIQANKETIENLLSDKNFQKSLKKNVLPLILSDFADDIAQELSYLDDLKDRVLGSTSFSVIEAKFLSAQIDTEIKLILDMFDLDFSFEDRGSKMWGKTQAVYLDEEKFQHLRKLFGLDIDQEPKIQTNPATGTPQKNNERKIETSDDKFQPKNDQSLQKGDPKPTKSKNIGEKHLEKLFWPKDLAILKRYLNLNLTLEPDERRSTASTINFLIGKSLNPIMGFEERLQEVFVLDRIFLDSAIDHYKEQTKSGDSDQEEFKELRQYWQEIQENHETSEEANSIIKAMVTSVRNSVLEELDNDAVERSEYLKDQNKNTIDFENNRTNWNLAKGMIDFFRRAYQVNDKRRHLLANKFDENMIRPGQELVKFHKKNIEFCKDYFWVNERFAHQENGLKKLMQKKFLMYPDTDSELQFLQKSHEPIRRMMQNKETTDKYRDLDENGEMDPNFFKYFDLSDDEDVEQSLPEEVRKQKSPEKNPEGSAFEKKDPKDDVNAGKLKFALKDATKMSSTSTDPSPESDPKFQRLQKLFHDFAFSKLMDIKEAEYYEQAVRTIFPPDFHMDFNRFREILVDQAFIDSAEMIPDFQVCGVYENDKLVYGIRVSENGSVYIGNFKDNAFDGQGVFFQPIIHTKSAKFELEILEQILVPAGPRSFDANAPPGSANGRFSDSTENRNIYRVDHKHFKTGSFENLAKILDTGISNSSTIGVRIKRVDRQFESELKLAENCLGRDQVKFGQIVMQTSEKTSENSRLKSMLGRSLANRNNLTFDLDKHCLNIQETGKKIALAGVNFPCKAYLGNFSGGQFLLNNSTITSSPGSPGEIEQPKSTVEKLWKNLINGSKFASFWNMGGLPFWKSSASKAYDPKVLTEMETRPKNTEPNDKNEFWLREPTQYIVTTKGNENIGLL